MLTPVDVQNKVFKGGIGFDKKDVESFMSELASDYGMLYRSNVELKDKVATLDESLQHYRSIEESMQKALTLSEKTAEETIIAANDKARQINTEAEKKAEAILADAKAELQETKDEIYRLQKQHATFKEQFTKILEAQRKIMDGEMIDIDLGAGFEPSYQEGGFGNYSGGSFGSEGGLSGLAGGGGYVGTNSFDEGRERTNQDPAINRGTLNMDPFADAMNGGGRFSRQTGGSFNGNSKKKNTSGTGNAASKPTLNVKNTKPGASKVRKNFTTAPDSQASIQNAENTAQTSQRSVENMQTQPKTSQMGVAAAESPINPVKQQASVSPQAREQVQGVNRQTVHITPKSVPENESTLGNSEQAAPSFKTVVPEASPEHRNSAADNEPTQVTGEVEDRINESTMLDSEDNYSTGFDFVSEDDVAAATEPQATTGFFSEDAVTGEVEDKINEATMLDSEDNYTEGFDFVSEDDLHMASASLFEEANTVSSVQTFEEMDEDTYSGEVEDKVNESTMLDSEDNYTDGFDFIVGNDAEDEEIPTIFPNFSGDASNNTSLNYDNTSNTASLNSSTGSLDAGSLNIDPFHDNSDDDVLIGDVEDNPKQSNLIGNADDEEEGFNFL